LKNFDVAFIKKLLNESDKANLIHSAYSLAYAGIGSYARASELTSYLNSIVEPQLVPLKTFMWHIFKLTEILEHRAVFTDMRVKYKKKNLFLLFIKKIGLKLLFVNRNTPCRL
jgi:hypothetical protein